ncbi:Pho91p [Sporobolomyces salmoneus]|uniref:Pho91p n=1 Tax=Sporobolomyces salmoneus TaxID=183962 RepID=UPI003173B68A
MPSNPISFLQHLFQPTYHTLQHEQPTDSDLELQPLAPPPPSAVRSPQSRYRRASLFYSSVQPSKGKMKFSHSLLFNAVPDWNNHYLAYDALKAQIYKFEKSALDTQAANGPPTSYRDDTNSADVEGGHANSADAHKAENEKIFVEMLDKELKKITDFYASKEKELLEDLVYLEEDLEKFREGHFSDMDYDDDHRGRATSGASDSEDEEGGEEEDSVPKGDRSGFSKVLTDPREYDAAIRAGRKTLRPSNDRTTSGESQPSKKGRSKSSSKRSREQNGHERSKTTSSETADLLGMDAEEEETILAAQGNDRRRRSSASEALSTSGRRPSYSAHASDTVLQGGQSLRKYRSGGKMRDVAARMSTSFLAEEEGDMTGASDWAIDTKIMYKRRLAALFTSLSELKQFVDLNYTGLSKVLKKYDKVTGSDLRSRYMSSVVDHAFPFEPATQTRLQNAISSIVPLYAELATNGNEDFALKQLKAHLREHVVLERNTVWREMIGLERKGWSGRGGTGASRGISTDLPVAASTKALELTEIKTPVGRFRVPAWINQQVVAGGLATLLFFVILSAQWFDRVEEQNCLALLSFVTIFWALEIVPLFVTALFVPFLVVILRVIRSTDGEDRRLTSPEATKYIFSQMFSPTIMLLLGGFTLAAALSKQNIDKVLATKVLSLAGTRPRSVLFAYMCVACFASMWISNVAAPVLCYSLITPILRTLPRDSPFAKSLILGIALASNIGGMASPISSPQNLIALEYMNPPISWLGWFAVSIPVALICVVIIWLLLLWSYRTGRNVVINPVRVNKEPWTGTQYFVAGVTLATIALWCVESKLSWLFGDMGIIAILPIVMFYGSGILRKADFDHSPWSIVFLAMGGIGLGKAVLSSGLLDDIDRVIERVVLGLDIWPILALFSVIVLVIATFISHTIAAVLVVPIAAQIGTAMDVPHPRLLIFATSLICSAGMGLPVSGFPNLQAISLEDDVGQPYLTPADFFKNGVPASIFATTIVVTLGYGIMRLLGL